MESDGIVFTVLGIAAGLVLGPMLVYGIWRLRSILRIKRAGPAPLLAHRQAIWRDPGAVERLDLAGGPGGAGGAPQPPFTFVEEHMTGSAPSLSVDDARGRRWRVKWGDEVCAETFGARLVWAAGYFVETNYFVPEGRIEGVTELARAHACFDEQRRFQRARFELDEAGVRKQFDEHGWAWHDNPFVGTRELNGLKIMLMLISNWDNKDVRDVARGSNTAIFEYPLPGGGYEARYLIIDWGGSMGRWGTTVITRGKWDCEGYAAQSPQFIAGVGEDGVVQWGYTGQRTADAAAGITVDDVRWLHGYVGRLSDDQLRAGLKASGATPEEVEVFTRVIRDRIDQLRPRVTTLRHPRRPRLPME